MAAEEGLIVGDYTKDGTVDLKGNPILRSKRGGWKACSFIVVYEVVERMAYFGIASNMMIYLTTELHLGTVTASNTVTNWTGTMWLMPVVGAYIADAYLGHYWTFLVSTGIYFSGMCLLTLAVTIHGLRPSHCANVNGKDCEKASTLQLTIFYLALYVLAIGTGGTKSNIVTIGADQFDDSEPKEKAQKLSFFNWWLFSIFTGILLGTTILVYIQDNVGWSVGYAIPTVGLLISIVIFLAGTPLYRHRLPTGSPFTRMARVLVAALRKCRVPLPEDPKELYELGLEDYEKKRKSRIEFTPTLRFLNKACVQTGSFGPWMLCTVTQVEETKQMLRMVPIWVATFVPSIIVAQNHTLIVKQCTTLDRSMGRFNLPPASLNAFVTISMLVSIIVYDRFFVKLIRRWTKNPRGITLLQRMGVGLVLYTIVMIIAALLESYRLSVARRHHLVESGRQLPLTVFILLPQFMLFGIAESFIEVARSEFFYDQAPESMKSLGSSYPLTSHGVGNYLSTFLLSFISHITKRNGHKGWIRNNLNDSHLNYYFAFIAILSFSNFIFFLVVAKSFTYKAEVSNSTKLLGEELEG